MTDPAAPRALAAALGIFRAVAVVGLLVAALLTRVILAGEHEIAAGSDALRAGDARAAVEHSRRAASWYAPGAPHVGVAYARLIALATTSEGLGDRELALFAWRGVRTAALETRWVVTPHDADLERANQAIAKLEAAAPRPPGTRTDPPATIQRAALEALMRDEAPQTGWVAALVAAAVAWIGGALWVVRRGITAGGQLGWSHATPGLIAIAAGVAVWLLAIWRA